MPPKRKYASPTLESRLILLAYLVALYIKENEDPTQCWKLTYASLLWVERYPTPSSRHRKCKSSGIPRLDMIKGRWNDFTTEGGPLSTVSTADTYRFLQDYFHGNTDLHLATPFLHYRSDYALHSGRPPIVRRTEALNMIVAAMCGCATVTEFGEIFFANQITIGRRTLRTSRPVICSTCQLDNYKAQGFTLLPGADVSPMDIVYDTWSHEAACAYFCHDFQFAMSPGSAIPIVVIEEENNEANL